MRLLYLCFFFLFTAFGHPIKNYNPYPKKDFIYPVAGPILLSGTFGELRSNHFHAGIDIKGFVGQPIVAAAKGYVSRIKVESGGYGNVLYLNHPNGYTTVYAHLKKFPKAVEKYIRKIQYQKKQFEVDLFPKAGLFSFEQGAEIGQMGVTGRSFGPHLHFEIRDTKTEEPINPLLFGLLIKDNIPPKMHQLKIYGLNPKRETLTTKTYNLQGKWKVYRAPGDTLTIGAWRIGVGLKVYDHMNGASNWNGIYELTMLVDGQLQYQYRLEKFAFHHTRYINAHLDYAEQVAKKSYINRCYRLPGNKLPIYTQAKENGVVELSKEKAKKIELITTDFDGNESKLVFWVKRGEVSPPKNKSFNYLLPYKEKNVVKDKTAELSFPLGTFYEDLYMQYGVSEEPNESYYSAVYHIHDYTVPVHKYFDIAITPTQIPANQMNKAFIAYCRKGRPPLNCGGEWGKR